MENPNQIRETVTVFENWLVPSVDLRYKEKDQRVIRLFSTIICWIWKGIGEKKDIKNKKWIS